MIRESQKEAQKRYEKKFERINCRFEKGTRERIKNTGCGSANKFIQAAVEEKLQKLENL